MHQALYRKWRPQTFDDVFGQEHITSILKYEAEHGLFSHAYLFCGSRGTGKTTCAKILAKVVNCEHPKNGSPCGECESCKLIANSAATDILEMDAASNNGVDNVRDIRDEVAYSPSALKYRVYIVDEVHMLSGSAFNALLKTLEEPPEHVIFILATTELQKLPATIISRCQRFDFHRIAVPVLMKRIMQIAEAEGIELEEDAAFLIAKMSQGGMRDSISLLELCAGSHQKITPELVSETVGSTGRSTMIRVAKAIAARDYETILSEINEVVASSKDLLVFWQDLISLYRDMLVMRTSANASAYLDLTESEAEELRETAALFTREVLLFHSKLLEEGLLIMQKSSAVKRMTAEFTLIRMCDAELSTTPESLLARISALERTVDTLKRNPPAPTFSEGDSEKEPVLPLEETAPVKENPHHPIDSAKAPEVTGSPDGAIPVSGKRNVHSGSLMGSDPTSSDKASSGKRILKPLRGWPEVTAHFEKMHPMFLSIFGGSRAFQTENGKIVVRFQNQFKFVSFEQNGSRDTLRGELSYLLKRDVRDNDLILEIAAEKGSAPDLLDEIIEESSGESSLPGSTSDHEI